MVDDTEGRRVDPDVIVSAVEQAPVILLICEGPDLMVVGFNAELRALMPGREAVGRPLRDVFYELNGQQFMTQFTGAYQTGKPSRGQQWRVHLDRPDGSVNEIFVDFTIAPWRWPDGTVRGVVGVGHDITEIVRARVAAEEQAAHLRERYEQTRDVVTALQQELLPPGLPVLPEIQVAASYLLAEADTAAGGDWFDAIARPDGSLALIVGDVVGHGVTASGIMGQLRAVLQDRLDGGADLAEALYAADRFARQRSAARSTTVCVALLNPANDVVTYCTAGHPPPLVIAADGRTRYLPGTGAAPLGTGGSFPVREDSLGVGDLLLLYSDGILERPGRSVPGSSAELAEVAVDIVAGRAFVDPLATVADRVCTQAVELLVRATGHADDITLLAAQRVPPAPPLCLELPAELTSLRSSRIAFKEWLDRIGVSSEDVFLLQHGLSELVTNAIEHAFDGDLGRDRVTVEASLSARGFIEATVTDHGRWREPTRQETRGRGLALTAQLVESLRVEPTGTGTTATIRHLASRPARMLTDELPVGERPNLPERAGMTVTELPGDDETRIRVDGVVDAETAAGLRHELLRRSRGGTVPLDVDLTGVTHLASAGVSALHHVAERHAEQRAKLTLRALPGSPAEHVLTLVALPHTTEPSG